MAAKMSIAGLLVLGCLVILPWAEADVVPTCPSDLNGKITYPYNCVLYVDCHDGTGTVKSCLAGMVFNPAKSECDLAAAVPDCHDGGFLEPPIPASESSTKPVVSKDDV